MPWKRMLAYITGSVNESLLHKNTCWARSPPLVSRQPPTRRVTAPVGCIGLRASSNQMLVWWPKCTNRPSRHSRTGSFEALRRETSVLTIRIGLSSKTAAALEEPGAAGACRPPVAPIALSAQDRSIGFASGRVL